MPTSRKKYGCIVKFTRELVELFLNKMVLKNVYSLEWVLKVICLANLGLLQNMDEIEATVFDKENSDLFCCKLRSRTSLAGLTEIPEGHEYPEVTLLL